MAKKTQEYRPNMAQLEAHLDYLRVVNATLRACALAVRGVESFAADEARRLLGELSNMPEQSHRDDE